jgi:protein-L-isoaspartate(D-aspartate) O-methyltransferase
MDFAMQRRQMVQHQLRGRGITDERLLAVMDEAPRHLFVPARQRANAYQDEPLPIGLGQTISQPYMVAKMTELLLLAGTETVLEIGTGSGYQAAVLGRLAAQVWTIERHPELAAQAHRVLMDLGMENVRIVIGDGTLGLPEQAPFDAVIVTAAAPRVPEPLRQQLAIGGRMVIPVSAGRNQELLLIEKLPPEGETWSGAGADETGAGDRAAGADDGAAETRGSTPGAGDGSKARSAPWSTVPCRFQETAVLGCIFVPLVGELGYAR